jgi:hypothetical protein
MLLEDVASITVYASQEQIATEQVRIEEQQRVLGIVPNFYVVYDAKNAVPLSTKMKFRLAIRVVVDPVTIGGDAILAGIQQAGDTPDYVQGAKGYGQRLGANAAGGASDILIGGAVLPSLLHQDPRYFYQGTGTTNSRLKHALLSPFVCRGDSGKPQVNLSSLGGDLASSALSNIYYPRRAEALVLCLAILPLEPRSACSAGSCKNLFFAGLPPRQSQKASDLNPGTGFSSRTLLARFSRKM